MKRILLLILFAGIVLAQNTLDPNNTSTSASGSISVNGTDCTNSNACVWIVAPTNGTSAAIQLSGTFTATLQFEKSVAGSVWVAATSTGNATSATSAGIYSFTVVGARFLRVRASAYSAGPVVVNITATVSGGSGGGSGSGSSLPATTNLIKGDGLGNGADSGISVDASGNVAISAIVPITVSTSGPVSPTQSGFYVNNASGALTYTLPTITSGLVGQQMCFRNAVTKTGAITLTAPASTYIEVAGAVGSAAGTLVSGGALGDSACVVSIDTTHYYAFVGYGSWTNN